MKLTKALDEAAGGGNAGGRKEGRKEEEEEEKEEGNTIATQALQCMPGCAHTRVQCSAQHNASTNLKVPGEYIIEERNKT